MADELEMTGLEILQRQQIGELTRERDTLKAENARLTHVAMLLAKSLTDDMIVSVREDWGATNAAVLQHFRDEVLEHVAALDA